MLAVSWVAAVVACLGYGSASILQAVGARRVDTARGASGLAAIFSQIPYLLGLGLDTLAFLGNVIALRELPLFLVQTIIAASIGVTAVIAYFTGSKLTGRDWASLGLLAAGLILLGLSAAPDMARRVPMVVGWVIFAGAAIPVVTLIAGLRLRGRASALVLATASGLGFSGVAIASRGLGAHSISLHLLTDPLTWAVLAHGAVALSAFALALQRGAVTTVTAITFMVELLLPSVVGLVVFGDQVTAGFVPWAIAGFAASIAATLALVRFAS